VPDVAPLPVAPAAPPHTMRAFRGAEDTVRTMIAGVKGHRGERSVLLRSLTEQVVRDLWPKDYLSEIIAIRNFVAEKVRYLNDPLTTEWVKDPQRLAEEIMAHGRSNADCDELCALILAMTRQCGRQGQVIVVGFNPMAPGHFSHTFARVKEPKSGKWIVVDPVAGTDEATMLARVATWKAYDLD